ncbi:MAG: ROK family protein [Planctomycetota bacterium]
MNPSSLSIGIDLGGTHVRLGVVDHDGRVLADARDATPGGLEPLLEWLGEAAATVGAAAEVDGGLPSGALPVGLGLPGLFVDDRSGVVRAHNLPWLEGVPLAARVAAALGAPRVVLQPDGVAGAWGEYRVRVPRPRRFGYLALGTGVGGGVVLDGEIVRHTNHSAGHLGMLPCDPAAATDPRAGSLDAMASGAAIRAEVEELGFDAALERAAQRLAIGVSAMAHLYRLDTVVLGGGAVEAAPALAEAVAARLAGRLLLLGGLSIEASRLGRHAGLVGAAWLAI